jgi:hypothetical protein
MLCLRERDDLEPRSILIHYTSLACAGRGIFDFGASKLHNTSYASAIGKKRVALQRVPEDLI